MRDWEYGDWRNIYNYYNPDVFDGPPRSDKALISADGKRFPYLPLQDIRELHNKLCDRAYCYGVEVAKLRKIGGDHTQHRVGMLFQSCYREGEDFWIIAGSNIVYCSYDCGEVVPLIRKIRAKDLMSSSLEDVNDVRVRRLAMLSLRRTVFDSLGQMDGIFGFSPDYEFDLVPTEFAIDHYKAGAKESTIFVNYDGSFTTKAETVLEDL